MKPNNLIITDENGRLLYIGEGLVPGIVKKRPQKLFGYGAGRLDPKDSFVVFSHDVSGLAPACRKALEKACDEILPQNGAVIAAGVYPGGEVKSLIKVLEKSESCSAELLDTVFHGQRLIISRIFDDAKRSVLFQVDDQQIVLPENHDDDSVLLLIFNEDGIHYYGSTSDLASLFSGESYEPFWDEKLFIKSNVHIKQIIDENLISALHIVAESKKAQIIRVRDNLYLVNCLKIPGRQISSSPINIWEVLTESDILSDLEEDSRNYMSLYSRRQNDMSGGYTFGLWGDNERISKIRWRLQKASVTNTTILLTGESGTGKTFLAREIHKSSRRHNMPFIHVNCAAIPYNLIESELFGYESGAFTGARHGGKAGYFEMAQGGTLFLDEITELPLALQGKLLEVIQNKTYFRVGGEKKKQADVRLIAATNRNLPELVANRRFREDLYYRINVFPIEIPPLRKQLDSLFRIVTDLLPEICDRLGVSQQVISAEALKKMQKYDWPGNIRELENVIEKACILSDGHVILPADIELSPDSEIEENGPDSSRDENHTLHARKDAFEKEVIESTLKTFGGSRTKTADYLGIGKTSLFEKMKKYGISEPVGKQYQGERNDK